MACPPEPADRQYTLVRLTDVPLATRYKVANRVIAREGLVGYEALELMIAATNPRHNPDLMVRAELARKVMKG